MKILKIFNEENISEIEFEKLNRRIAVRGIVFDKNNQMAILRSVDGWYEIPGGGVEKNEKIKDGFLRECREEVGCNVKIIKEIGRTLEIRYKKNMVNDTFWYISKVVGEKGEPAFAEDEKDCGFEIIWLSVEKTIKLFNSSPEYPDLYRRYLKQRALLILEMIK